MSYFGHFTWNDPKSISFTTERIPLLGKFLQTFRISFSKKSDWKPSSPRILKSRQDMDHVNKGQSHITGSEDRSSKISHHFNKTIRKVSRFSSCQEDPKELISKLQWS